MEREIENSSSETINVTIENYKEIFNESQNQWEPLIKNYLPDFEEYFLSPDNFELIQNLLIENFPNESSERLLEWKIEDMKQILGKIMIFDSVRPTLENASQLAKRLREIEKENLKILEICTGAGISTMMTWKEIKKSSPEKTCTLVTVDDALESTIIAETLLKFKGVPFQRVEDIHLIPEQFDGVVLLNLEGNDTVKRFAQKGENFDAVVSDHGIGYWEKDLHEQTINNIVQHLLSDGGILSVCSLENDTKVSLAYLQMVKQILFNKNIINSIPNDDIPYQIDEKEGTVLIRAINSKDSAGLYKVLQVLFYEARLSDFLGYIKSIAKVAKVTKTLAKEVKSPIKYSQSLLEGSSVQPPFDGQKYSIARTLWYEK
ncbi:MAG TPA: hypothetical protein P5059_02590 [Candidatus Dojkabacteria bacterium]|nr:hypothetical protein [Candidatus Dojkabacteria bacterium]